ncbi:hypothetical protein IGI04_007066 [Brassica rapa subsp. trilocularis]|uniref:Uncharacterized protein n=1 Tax=Brassica rapa subsp. trilocularis TaxID=1813537 RepID=A0ABQ7NIN7_BRACM|nr:hypothetical protein IGI04_007066 [Brassica rapa subsp. trilocularis]
MQQFGIYRCMPSGNRSNKEKDLLFSDDPAHLERTIRRGQRSTSLDATTSSSIDTHNLYDQAGHLRYATGQKIDAQGTQNLPELLQPKPTTQTQESMIEEMLDRVLLGQQHITVDFNGKIDSAYNNLNTKIETLGTQVRKLKTRVIQTGETIKRQEAFAREAGADKGKHHVNAIIDDDFWQVVRNEKLEEGDFKIESSMSLGGSQWCRPMSMNSHQSTYHDEDRWTDYSSHRSTASAKSTDCNAVRILTHEEFAAKHPHPPSPFYDRIDRSVEPTIDRQSESDVDRHNTPPIDRQAPLTYRVRLPSIDNDYINALRPPPKPLANPPEPKPNPLNSSPESVQEEQEAEGRRFRKRKEKIPKNLKREANDKEMDGFTKRFLRIPIEKPFDEAYFTHRLWMFFRETKVTKEDIRRMFHQLKEKMKHRITLTKKSDPGKFAIPCVVKGVEFPHSMCETEHHACHCGAEYESEYETEYSESIDTPTFPSIDSNESTGTDDRNNTSLDVMHPVDHFAPPNHCYQHFAFQPPSKRGHDDYSIGSWADSGFHESFAVDTVITSPNEEHTEEYDEGYWKERAIEMPLQDERLETHKFTNTFPTSFDAVHPTSVDTHPRPAKQPLTSIDTHTGTSIDIRTAAKIQEQENISSPTRFIDTYINRFATPKPPPHTRANTQAKKMNTLPSTSTEKSMKNNHLKNTSSAEITLPSIDATVSTSIDTTLNPNLSISKLNNNANIDYGFLTSDEFGIFRDPDGNARAIYGKILQVSREDIADILQVANGPDNLFSQQRGTPDVIQTDPHNHVGVATTEINPDLSRQPKRQESIDGTTETSIDGTTETSIDRVIPTSIDRDDPTSIDRRYEFENRAFDMYGARKFTWEPRDEYGVYREECGHARGVAGEMIPVTKDDIRKLLERASLFEESHICLPEHATSFTLTRLAPELYTKDEIDEMVFGICGAQQKQGEELKTLVEDTHQLLDRGYNELFRSMAEMRTKIESLRQQLEKEATTSASIDAPHATSIDVSFPTAQIPAEPQCSTQHRDEWKVSYIDTRINDVYCPLNNNVDWLSTKIELLQQDLDTIRKKNQQAATSIDMYTFTSLDAKVSAMNERLRTYEGMYDHFISPVMIDLNKLSSQLLHAQKDIENITNQIFLQAKSASIDRLRGLWIDGKKPVELLPYTAAEVDKITSKIYTTIDTMEERLDKHCDDIYFPFDNKISGLDSHTEWLQKEVEAIQRQLAAQHQISASIDRTQAKSIDGSSPRSTNEHIIASIDAESTPISEQLIHKTIDPMQKELTDLSAYAYDNIGWHEVSIDNVQERLQNISNVLEKMDNKWRRNDEATRNSTKDAKADQPINYTLALNRMKFFRQVWKSSKRDLEAVIFKACFRKELLDIGQKEVNRTWWQPPLSFDSWKPVQSWSLILQWKQTLTQERNLEREKLGTNFYLQLQISHKGHFTRADHVEVDERKNNRSMRISADDLYQEMPR